MAFPYYWLIKLFYHDYTNHWIFLDHEKNIFTPKAFLKNTYYYLEVFREYQIMYFKEDS